MSLLESIELDPIYQLRSCSILKPDSRYYKYTDEVINILIEKYGEKYGLSITKTVPKNQIIQTVSFLL